MATGHFSGGVSHDTVGSETIEIDAPRVHELTVALTSRFPALAGHLEDLAVSVDGEIYNDAPYRRLRLDSEIYFIPRVAGG